METKESMFIYNPFSFAQLINVQADNLQGSGVETVLMTSLYAVVGAVALERGGEVANKVVQDKILAPLGFTFSSDL